MCHKPKPECNVGLVGSKNFHKIVLYRNFLQPLTEGEISKIAFTGGQLLLYIALAVFVIGLIVVAVDFANDGNLSVEGRNAFVALIIIAVVVVIIAVILGKVAP